MEVFASRQGTAKKAEAIWYFIEMPAKRPLDAALASSGRGVEFQISSGDAHCVRSLDQRFFVSSANEKRPLSDKGKAHGLFFGEIEIGNAYAAGIFDVVSTGLRFFKTEPWVAA